MNRFYFIFLFSFISSSVFCQQIVDFPANDAIWDISIHEPPYGNTQFTDQIIRYYVDGDTLINNNTYMPLSENYGFKYELACSPPNFGTIINNTISPPTYYAAIRTDSNLIVKAIFGETNTEMLLYRFDLEIGDTVLNKNQVVSQIDTLFLNNKPIKRYTLENDYENSWIDGIGCISGLFFPSIIKELSLTISLNCYKESETDIINTHSWQEYGCYPCGLFDGTITGIENEYNESDVQINNHESVINISSNTPLILLNIIDMNGKVIYTSENNNNGEISIEKEGLSKGIHVAQIIDSNNKVSIKKFFIY